MTKKQKKRAILKRNQLELTVMKNKCLIISMLRFEELTLKNLDKPLFNH
jgi:hypothetical protein